MGSTKEIQGDYVVYTYEYTTKTGKQGKMVKKYKRKPTEEKKWCGGRKKIPSEIMDKRKEVMNTFNKYIKSLKTTEELSEFDSLFLSTFFPN